MATGSGTLSLEQEEKILQFQVNLSYHILALNNV